MLGEALLERAYKQPFLTEMPRRPRYLNGVKNPGGEVTWATWFELTSGEYTRITVEANTPTNRVSRKPSTCPCGEI